MEYFTINGGQKYPAVGYGTYKSTKGDGAEVLETAISCGYRYFDTASFYENEEELGKAIKDSKGKREGFLIASKVFKTEMGFQNTLDACNRSLKRLGLEYLDLYLIHWPKAEAKDENWENHLKETWLALEKLWKEGLVREIGVCNCLPHHLEVIEKYGTRMPAVNQIEFHPGYLQMEAVRYCQERNILVQAWSPLGRTRVLKHDLLLELAGKAGVSAAQICLRFCYQLGIMSLPKASVAERMNENMDIFQFEISREDMERLLGMPEVGWSGEHPDRERVYF